MGQSNNKEQLQEESEFKLSSSILDSTNLNYRNNNGVSWNIEGGRVSNSFGIYQSAGAFSGITYFNMFENGRIGINTTTDAGQRLQINDSLRLVPTSTVPTASAGAMYYDSATNKLKLYDGTNWVDLN